MGLENRLFTTREMEKTLLWLAARRRLVVFFGTCHNKPSIRPRLNTLAEAKVPVWFYRPWFPQESASQIKLWRARGGVLVSRATRVYDTPRVPIGPHDDLVVGECPPSPEYLNAISRNATGAVIVFKPPTWELHEERLRNNLRTADNVKQTFLLSMLLEPNEPEGLREFYRQIMTLPDAGRGRRILRMMQARKFTLFWRTQLREMVRRGNIARHPEEVLAQTMNEVAARELAEVRDLIEAAPPFPLPDLAPSSQPSVESA